MAAEFEGLIKARYQLHIDQGRLGADLFEAMASDAEIPLMLEPEQAAHIYGTTAAALKQQRAKRTGPPFLRVTHKIVTYPRPDLFRHLAGRYVRQPV